MTKLSKNAFFARICAEPGQMFSALIMLCKHIDLTEDALQDVLAQANR